eukprot:CAMPEP_0179978640 /NCGR_PEP_ID=MMETSP0983-20121128/40810_1 /TAXON_ID=483367 /ORGANISM="non described non described, Strain CCMP 2436" /LENGTH=64 /DNA_ID=CAMNT_0021896127 /DNA_START=316 /DNA_END=509 /DNA_ORIENTATION=+
MKGKSERAGAQERRRGEREDRSRVHKQGDHLAGDHDGMPTLDLHGDHDELSEDERGEGDANHVH